ncbi:MAG TPA: ATP-binding protein, partial [Candidatus Korarchaeota archaeon]|nr:ATP-binding protein [Candidatus Korarchaeota archaeon]
MGFMSMGFKIPRFESREIEESRGWMLLFGRRKTGKTFLVRNMLKYDFYFFVSRGRKIFLEEDGKIESLQYEVFLERLRHLIGEDVVIVIDEFQRLPDEFLDFLHYTKSKSRSKLILVGSSIQVSRRILSRRSPLLGIIKPIHIGLIRPLDILFELSKHFPPYKAIQLSSLLRDPWILEFIDPKGSIEEVLEQIIQAIKYNARSLVGEVFQEEDKELTERYEAILRALGDGCNTPSQVANYVSSLLTTPLKSQDVKKYISNLVEMGIAEKIKIYGKKRHIYRIESPLLDLFHYLDAKYGFYEMKLPIELLRDKAMDKLPFYYENFVVKLFSEILGCEVQKTFKPEFDGVLVRGKRLVAVIEVKYGVANRNDLARFLAKTDGWKCRKILVAKEAEEMDELEVYTPEKIIGHI